MPRLGGLAIAAGLAVGVVLGSLTGWHSWVTKIPRQELGAFAFGTFLVFVVGTADDLFGVSAVKKFLIELLAAWLLVRVGWSFEVLRLPVVGTVDLGLAGPLVSLLWIVGVTNAINLIDGLDGLAAGVVVLIAGSLAVYSGVQGNPGTVVILAAVVGSCLGFLRHNWEPARIFMGDSGALTLGFVLGALSVHSSLKAQAAVAILVPVLALGVPVFDTLLVMVLRFFSGGGRPLARRFVRMFEADRSHLHHSLLNLGLHRARVVRIIYVAVLACCAGALFVAMSGESELGLALALVSFCAIALVRFLGFGRAARLKADREIAEAREMLGLDGSHSDPGPRSD